MGSFNPVHIGHLITANTILNKTDVDEVWFVVSPMSPDKQDYDLKPAQVRCKILKDSVKNNRKLKVSDVELDMETPNYTHKTLKKLKELHPKHEFSIIMGSDNAINLFKWSNIDYIKENHKLYVVQRPNSNVDVETLVWYDNFEVVDMPEVCISSTTIRKMVREGDSIEYLVPKESINRVKYHYK